MRRSARRAALRAAERDRQAAEAALAELRRAYDDATAEGGVVLFQQVGVGVDAFHVSASVAGVLGWDPQVFLGAGVLRALVHPDDLSAFDAALSAPLAGSAPPPDDDDDGGARPGHAAPVDATGDPVVRIRAATGTWARVQVRSRPTPGTPALTRGTLVDVTADHDAAVRRRRFAEVVERSPAAHLVLEFTDPADPASLVLRAANDAARTMFHLTDEGVDGVAVDRLVGEATGKLLRAALFDVRHTGAPLTAERLALAEVPGTYLDLRVELLGDTTLSVVLSDVTATVALEQRLRHQASHDALTGLPNRELFEERVAAALAAADGSAPVGLVLVDLEDFRGLNDHLGVHLADRLLVEVGRRLVREVRGCAAVARLGGDRFALLTLPCSCVAEVVERGRAAAAALARPVELDGELVELRSAVAVAPSGPSTPDAAALLRVAEAALRTAKRAEGRFAVADDEPAPSSIHRLELISELRQGLANGELELHLQPVVDLRGGRVARAEAHLRWRRGAERGGVPVELLELAEQSGLIQPLTRWMVGEVAAAALELRRRGHDLTVTCDLSLRELADPALCDFLALLVSSGELDPSTIEFEVAEVELMDDPIRAREVLGRLGALGLRIVVDDFGTGYSSLGAIEPLPVSGLKIDRSFVSGVAAGASDGAVVRSTVELCHELGLTVAADGVADERTLEVLAGFGCDLAQGPHLSDALALEPFLERVAQLDAAARVWSGVSRTA